MNTSRDQAQALLRLAETLERAARQLRQLAGGGSVHVQPTPAPLPDRFVDSLRSSDRNSAAEQLSVLSHAQLGDVFTQVGGLSREKKRGKEWLIERILWHLFDFRAGHDIIRGSR